MNLFHHLVYELICHKNLLIFVSYIKTSIKFYEDDNGERL